MSALMPLLLDATTESLADLVALALERYLGPVDSDKCLAAGRLITPPPPPPDSSSRNSGCLEVSGGKLLL